MLINDDNDVRDDGRYDDELDYDERYDEPVTFNHDPIRYVDSGDIEIPDGDPRFDRY